MKGIKKTVAVFIIILAVIMAAAYLSLDSLVIFCLSKAYNLDISYAALKRSSFADFSFTSMTCIDKKRKVGFFSKSADIKTSLKGMEVDFFLHDVHFIKRTSEGATSYDSLSALVAAPFKSNRQYVQMSGSVRPLIDGLEVKSFTASGYDMKLTLKGAIRHNGIIKSDIAIYFSPVLIEKIPKELSSVLLHDEPDGWKSLAVGLSGDYKTPAIQVTGRLFRLTVKEFSSEK